jgi:hypothetical protein
MTSEIVSEPTAFFHDLGGLHDTEIERIEFDPNERSLALTLDDLHTNFEGLPEDRGRRPCILRFTGVARFGVDFDVSTDWAVRITDTIVEPDASGFRIVFQLNLGGGPLTGGHEGIVVTAQQLHIEDI